MDSDSSPAILTAHHLSYTVVNVIANAQEWVVLSTAYLRNWVHLQHAIESAINRGVAVHLVIRTPDGSSREKQKTESEISKLASVGVHVHKIDRLHAKAYLSEREAIITSFNLVGASQESVELGAHFTNTAVVEKCLAALADYAPHLLDRLREKSPHQDSKKEQEAVRPNSQDFSTGYCIGCQSASKKFELERPLCRVCYRASSRGKSLKKLEKTTCYACQEPNDSSVEEPLCGNCKRAHSALE